MKYNYFSKQDLFRERRAIFSALPRSGPGSRPGGHEIKTGPSAGPKPKPISIQDALDAFNEFEKVVIKIDKKNLSEKKRGQIKALKKRIAAAKIMLKALKTQRKKLANKIITKLVHEIRRRLPSKPKKPVEDTSKPAKAGEEPPKKSAAPKSPKKSPRAKNNKI